MNTVRQYGLDGVDIDWEYPDPGTSGNNYTALMQQLSTALHNEGKLLTAAVVSEGGTANGVQPAVFAAVDWLNIMAYDGGSPHANYDWSINAANFWKNRGLPKAKTVLGVPFYSRPGYYTYAQLVAMDPANANRDCATAGGAQQCYNGLPTIRRKTQWAMANAGGIMNWELSQDATRRELAGQRDLRGGDRRRHRADHPAHQPAGRPHRADHRHRRQVRRRRRRQLGQRHRGAAVRLQRHRRAELDGRHRRHDAGAGQVHGRRPPPARPTARWSRSTTATAPAPRSGRPQSNGTLRNPASGRCLDASNNSSANGTRLQIWDCFAGANQRWVLPA